MNAASGMGWKKAIAFEAIRAAMGVGGILPRALGMRVFETGGSLVHLMERRGRERARRNLGSVYGGGEGAERMARRVYRDLGRNAVDLARLERLGRRDLEALVEVSGYENLERSMAAGRGVIGITGHLGNWELMAAYLGRKEIPLTALATRLFDPRLDEWLARMRSRHGVGSILRGEAGWVRRVVRVLREGEMLGILMDLRCRREGIVTNFLGRPARTFVGPVRLAARTGAIIVPMGCWMVEGGRYRIAIERPIEPAAHSAVPSALEENTRECVRVLESFIRAAPTQWVWMHDRWAPDAV
ncbi:MAG: lysophospholipid acyltransferase family protein [Candidatus Eisenbacteria bacterium]